MKKNLSKRLRINGFALVATLMLLILLSLLAVGLLSLSAVTLRSSGQGSAQEEARANARMALMLAIGELQRYAGADTRITAPSTIVDPTGPPLLGAWKSWEGSDHDSQGVPLVPNYAAKTKSEANQGRFLKWLVSGAQQGGNPTTPGSLASKAAVAGTVPLLSKGTLGADITRQIHLVPQRVQLTANPASTQKNGAYAWWVSGENQKARLTQPYNPRTDSAAGWSDMAKTHSAPDPKPFGLEALVNDPENFMPDPNNPKSAGRAVSLRTAELLAGNNPSKPQQSFHDLSISSVGLLTNSATGGWRKDLSILSERWDSIYAGFPGGRLPMFRISPLSGATTLVPKPIEPAASVAASNTAAVAAITPAGSMFYPWSAYPVASSSVIFPVYRHGATASWQGLSDYLTSYRSIDFNSSTGEPSTPLKWTRVDYGRNGGSSMGGAIKPFELYGHLHAVRKNPILARVQWVFSVQARRNAPTSPTNKTYLVDQLVTPTYTLWNPYNTAIQVSGAFGVAVNKVPPVAWSLVAGTTPDPVAKSQHRTFIRGSAFAPDGTNKYDQQIVGNYGNAPLPNNQHFAIDGQGAAFPTSFTLAPGEAKVFSPIALQGILGGTGNMLDLKEGYDGSIPTGHPRNGNSLTGTPNSLAWTDALKVTMLFDNLTVIGAGTNYEGAGIALNFGKRPTGGWDRYITDTFTTYTSLTSTQFSQAYWLQPADLPRYNVSQIAMDDTSTPAKPTGNRPWTPIFSMVFGPRLSIGAGAGNDSNRPTKGLLQSSPFVSGVLTTSINLPSNHPVNGAYDFAYYGHQAGNSDTIPEDTTGTGFIHSGFQPGNGLSRLVLAELPLRPFASLGELQGWDLRAHNPMPPFQFNIIGNSDAVPMMPRNAIVRSDAQPTATNLQHDDSYCANHLLFDDWFFSSIAPEPRDFGKVIASDIDSVYRDYLNGTKQLVNRPYLRIPEDQGLSSADVTNRLNSVVKSSDGWQKVASRFEVEGMFNVNSTSVKAWRALLGHARKMKVPHHTKNGITIGSGREDHAVSRFPVAGDVKAGPAKGMSGAFPSSSEYTGFRTLTDAQLDDLAEKIVDQIRKRGPFLSLSEFVNRKLDNDEDLALAGAVQTALNALSDDPHKVLKGNGFSSNTMSAADAKLAGAGYEFPKAAEGKSAYGLPGWIRQADVLRPLAPILSARDDTFTIRAYGDARDAKGNVTARAWCEATVRRGRDFLNQSDAADSVNPPTSQQNQVFGRRFGFVSFRWLSQDEV